jgi:hypothetical protein
VLIGAALDAALYITKLSKSEHDTEAWQAAMEALLLVAEHDGPTIFARIKKEISALDSISVLPVLHFD